MSVPLWSEDELRVALEMQAKGWHLEEWNVELGRMVFSVVQDGEIIYQSVYFVDGLLEQNKAEYNSAESGWKGDWHKVASIPHNVLHGSGFEEAMRQRDQKFLKRFLNDSDNRAWRTKPGTV